MTAPANKFDKGEVGELLSSLFTETHPARSIAVEWLGYDGAKLDVANDDKIEKLLDDLLEAGHIEIGDFEACLRAGDTEAQPADDRAAAAHHVSRGAIPAPVEKFEQQAPVLGTGGPEPTHLGFDDIPVVAEAAQCDGPAADLSEAQRLLSAGMKLVALKPRTKQPVGMAWNDPANCVSVIDDKATGYGLPLAINNRCSIDPDSLEQARITMKAWGFDLNEIMNAGARTESTRPGSGGRSMFETAPEFGWVAFRYRDPAGNNVTVIELRAAGANLQDTIPGVLYGEGYTQRYSYEEGHRYDTAPPVPEPFAAFWKHMSSEPAFRQEMEDKALAALRAHGYPQAEMVRHINFGPGKALAFSEEIAPADRRLFNEAVSVESILQKHGYQWHKREKRYSAPGATGEPGIRRIKGHETLWQSDHGSDPLNGSFDACIAAVVLEHGGDPEAFTRWVKEHGYGLKTAEAVRDFGGEFAAIDAISPDPELAGLSQEDEKRLGEAKAHIEKVLGEIANDTGAAFSKEAVAAFRLLEEHDLPEYQRVMLKLAPYRLKSAIEKAIRETKRAEREAEQLERDSQTHHFWAHKLSSLAAASCGGVYPVSTRGEFFTYMGGLWKGIKPEQLSTKVATNFDGNANCEEVRDYKAIATHAMNLTQDETFFDDAPVGIACGDTFYRCTPTAVIAEPLGPQHRQVARIPFAPNSMPTPLFDKFLQETFMQPDGRGADRITLMQEVFGAVLLRLTHRYHKAVLFYDPFGRAGKGTISKIIEQLISASVTEAIPLQDWDNEYRLALMAPAWLNLVGEIDPDKPMATGVFKNVTGGDMVTGRIIYSPPFKFLPICTHIFSGNAFPPTRDHTDAFFARWLVIHFPNSRTRLGLQLNPNLANEIIANEMPGVVAWALAGAQRLLQQGGFTVTAEHSALINEWRRATNTIELFIAECCDVGAEVRTSKPTFYRAYDTWCRSNGHKPTSKYEAGRRLLGVGGLHVTEVESKGVSYFKGINVRATDFTEF